MNNTEKSKNVLTNIYQHLVLNYFEKETNDFNKKAKKNFKYEQNINSSLTTKTTTTTIDRNKLIDEENLCKFNPTRFIEDKNDNKVLKFENKLELLVNNEEKTENSLYEPFYLSLDYKKILPSINSRTSLSQKTTSDQVNIVEDLEHEPHQFHFRPQIQPLSQYQSQPDNNNNNKGQQEFISNRILDANNNQLSPQQRKILISERLLKTERIWYLPSLDCHLIIERLKDKPIGNFILTGSYGMEKSNCIKIQTPNLNNPLNDRSNNQHYQNNNNNNLILYLSNENNKITEHLIDIDENFYFYFKNDSSAKFKSILALLEYYITNDKLKQNQIKLTLPKAIVEANNLQQLNSLSLLEQDFWLNEFYFKYSSPYQTSIEANRESEYVIVNNQLKEQVVQTDLKEVQKKDTKRKSRKLLKHEHKFHTIDIKLASEYTTQPEETITLDTSSSSAKKSNKKEKKNKSIVKNKSQSKSLSELENFKAAAAADTTIYSSKSEKTKAKTSTVSRSKHSKKYPEKFYYDPRFNSYSNFNQVESHSNSNQLCTSRSHILNKSQFFSKFNWPHRFLTGKISNKNNHTAPVESNCKPEKQNQNQSKNNNNKKKSNILTEFVSNLLQSSKESNHKNNKNNTKTTPLTSNNIFFNQEPKELENSNNSKTTTNKLIKQNYLSSNDSLMFDLESTSPIRQNENESYDNNSSSKPEPIAHTNINLLSGVILTNNSNKSNINHKPGLKRQENFEIDDNLSINSCLAFIDNRLGNIIDPGKVKDNSKTSKFQAKNLIETYSSVTPKLTSKNTNNQMHNDQSKLSNSLGDKPGNNYENRRHQLVHQVDSQISNEYSEPFDLISDTKSSNQLVSQKSKSNESINNDLLIKSTYDLSLKKSSLNKTSIGKTCFSIDDDSAYSSCYQNQSEISTPKANLKIISNHNPNNLNNNQHSSNNNTLSKNEYNDTEEETMTTFDSSILLSSSSCSSSPLLSLLPYNSRFNTANNNNNNNQITNPILPIYSEYELVKDVLPKNQEIMANEKNNLEDIKSDYDLFKSTITAFDILSERCSELIELFDDTNCGKRNQSIELKRKIFKNSKAQELAELNLVRNTNNINSSKYVSSFPLPRYSNSDFLDRTLTFDTFMKSSALLSLSTSIVASTPLNEKQPLIENIETTTNQFNSIRSLIFKMSKNEKSIFGKNISEFIKCTQNSKEQNPNILMSNTRQFMNGIKNYLLKNDINNLDLRLLIEKERSNLDQTQILNIDCIIEDCLQSIVLQPLKYKIYYLIVDWLITDGSIISINKHIKLINGLDEEIECKSYLGLNNKNYIPSKNILKQLRIYYNRMQCEYAPLIKLKYMLFIINDLLSSIKEFESALKDFSNLEVKEILPVIIYSLSKCQMYAIQIEIDYIWNLVNRSLLTNEAVYYLNVMSSACYSLVNLNSSITAGKLNINDVLIDIYFPDERGQILKKRTIPVRPGSKSKEVISLISSKFKIYNSEDYALYVYENGNINKLKDDERPFEIRLEKLKSGLNIKFIYKQKTSNVVWSKNIENF